MKIFIFVLYIFAIVFCVLGFIGHPEAWAAAALSFFAASMIVIGQRRNLNN